jgi:5'-nucleotidase
MKTILIVNDDGINSPGIRAAVEAIEGLGKIVVVAPAVQQSGVGRSISLFSPVSVSEAKIDDVEAYSIAGTPVDAVIVGIYGIIKGKPDIIISGINIGENMSSEATTSGTVGAALEGASQEVPSIAVSIHSKERLKFEEIQPGIDFTLAKEVTRKIAKYILEEGLPKNVDLLNINVPENSNKNTGVRITKLARRMYTTRVQERFDPRGRVYFWIDGDAIYEAGKGTDVHAVRREQCISITPLKLDFTSYGDLDALKRLADIL